jgi:hypothetical protein
MILFVFRIIQIRWFRWITRAEIFRIYYWKGSNMGKVTFSIILVLETVLGCQHSGPRSVQWDRAEYNAVIQQTNNEQLLMNLVRLRYRDTPYFLEVASISSSLEFETTGLLGAEFPESSSSSYNLGVGARYMEVPTITYTPLQGDQFVTQLMSPVDLNLLLLLYHSGWSVERIFRVALQSINGVKNAPGASGPTPDYVPQYQSFLEVTKLLRKLQLEHALELGYAPAEDKKETVIELRIAPEVVDIPEVKRVYALLNLEPGRTRFPLTTEAGTGAKDRLAVVTRSMTAVFFYISQSVSVPLEHEQQGKATVTRDKQGNRFDWQNVTGDLISIPSAPQRPKNAYIAIRYRDHWFYIDDRDLTSKSTFSLLMQMFSLQAGEIKTTGPILTLPVTR